MFTYKNFLPLVLIMVFLFTQASSCDGASTTDMADKEYTDRQQEIYNKSQPLHFYNYSMPRDTLQQIYDSTMSAHNTWTVFLSMSGVPIDMCPSIGFPIPGGTQLTNPEKLINPGTSSVTTLPQAEPNGLFPPGANASTWILCVWDGKIEPRYSEPDVITYAHPVEVVNGQIKHISNGKSTITININPSNSSPVISLPSASP